VVKVPQTMHKKAESWMTRYEPVGNLEEGAVVDVTEIFEVPTISRVRGKIREGWISLFNTSSGVRYAVPVIEALNEYENLQKTKQLFDSEAEISRQFVKELQSNWKQYRSEMEAIEKNICNKNIVDVEDSSPNQDFQDCYDEGEFEVIVRKVYNAEHPQIKKFNAFSNNIDDMGDEYHDCNELPTNNKEKWNILRKEHGVEQSNDKKFYTKNIDDVENKYQDCELHKDVSRNLDQSCHDESRTIEIYKIRYKY